mmetsp:Transcript_13504/g.33936  ORF Transcript_13504/g.33936 Transcript_13504/m.33936 type:complete len:210 (-) Transcript_13504:466-1095(-)
MCVCASIVAWGGILAALLFVCASFCFIFVPPLLVPVLVHDGGDVLGLVPVSHAEDPDVGLGLGRFVALLVDVVEDDVLRPWQRCRSVEEHGHVEEREVELLGQPRRVLGEVLGSHAVVLVARGRRRRGLEGRKAVDVLGNVLLDLDQVVHVAHLVENRRLVRSVLPLVIHDELVLVHARGQELHYREVLAGLQKTQAGRPVVPGTLHVN